MNRLKFPLRLYQTTYPGSEKYIDKEHWSPVRSEAVPYDGPLTTKMKEGQNDAWLDAIEQEMQVFEKHNTTNCVYINTFPAAKKCSNENSWKPGVHPQTIPYDAPISTDPSKHMKKEEVSKWLNMVVSHIKE